MKNVKLIKSKKKFQKKNKKKRRNYKNNYLNIINKTLISKCKRVLVYLLPAIKTKDIIGITQQKIKELN